MAEIERLFPFCRRARIFVVGRPVMRRLRKDLHFVLITEDISANSQKEIRRDFAGIPIVQRYTCADIETYFGLKNTKVIGFRRSSLAVSVYRELQPYRLPDAPEPEAPADSAPEAD